MLEPTRDEKRDGTGDHDTQEVLTETHEQHEEVATVLQLPYSTQQQDQHDHNNVAGSAIPRLIPHVQVAQPASEITALTTQQIEADGRVVFVAQAATGNGGETAAAAQVVASSQGAEDVAVVARNVSTVAGNQPLLPAITQMSVAQGQGRAVVSWWCLISVSDKQINFTLFTFSTFLIVMPISCTAQQFYLMVPAGGHDPAAQVITQNVTTRAIAPRAQQAGGKQSVPRSIRDERRRSTHNEVERRRRDKINTWITELAKVVPDCQEDLSKQGQVRSQAYYPLEFSIGRAYLSTDFCIEGMHLSIH
jgi:hypothetical protein